MTAIEQFQGQSLMAQADMLSKSNLVPKAFRGKPADILVATLWGGEIGLGPISSMNYIDVIEGSPTLNAEGTNALIRRAGHSVIIDANDERCVIKGKRRDTGDEQTVTWTMDMAKRAGLAGKQVWKAYPEAMLFSRAIKQIARSLFPDVQMGMSYAPEEVASFAAPELLDTQPEALARGAGASTRKDEGAALTQGEPRPAERGATNPAPQQLAPPVPIDTTTGEIIDTASVGKPDGIVAAGQRATEQRHRYDPPPTPSSADNTRRINADLAADDYVDKGDAKQLLKRIGTLSGDALAAFNAGINAAGLTVPTTMKVGKDDYAKFVALLDGEVKVAS